MERRKLLAATAVVGLTGTAGCLGRVVGGESDSPTGAADSSENEIEVHASGEVETEPDQAGIRVGLEAAGDSADDVNDELAERAERLREAFEEMGITEENVEPGRYDIREERNGTGYVGTQTFQIEIDDVDRVGEIIDGAVEAGADDIGRVTFGVSDELRAQLRDEAIDHALANADEEAKHIAENRNVEITGTRSVSTSNVDVAPVRHDVPTTEADDSADLETEIDSGPVHVSASATVVYGFE